AQSYFYNIQLQEIQREVNANERILAHAYIAAGDYSWNITSPLEIDRNPDSVFYLVDNKDTLLKCIDIDLGSFRDPDGQSNNCNYPIFAQVAQSTLQTQQSQQGNIDLTVGDQQMPSLYISVPIQIQNATPTPTVGCLVLAEPLSTSSLSNGLLEK